MNRIHVITIIVLCFLQNISVAQYLPKSITPYSIDISSDKTSNLIFPFAIKSVDRGSSAVLAQKAVGVENILQLKAGEQNFKRTNLTVITDDGHFYSFVISYASEPEILNFSFTGDSSKAIVSNQSITEASFIGTANAIKSKRHLIHKSVWEQNIKLSLTNLYMKDGLLWLELGIENRSLIPFTPAYTRFFLKDIKTAKRTAAQENEIIPLSKTPLDKVSEHASQPYVLAFNPFTVPHSKELVIQVGEKEGSRLLTLRVSSRTLNKIKSWKEKN